LLTQAPKMKMSQLQKSDNIQPDRSEAFLKHLEETTELLENSHAKILLKKAIKQIRESKNTDTK
jgi:hypothetical protein